MKKQNLSTGGGRRLFIPPCQGGVGGVGFSRGHGQVRVPVRHGEKFDDRDSTPLAAPERICPHLPSSLHVRGAREWRAQTLAAGQGGAMIPPAAFMRRQRWNREPRVIVSPARTGRPRLYPPLRPLRATPPHPGQACLCAVSRERAPGACRERSALRYVLRQARDYSV